MTYEDKTGCSEMSAHKIRRREITKKERIQQSQDRASLKSRTF
jgi:hypothetical protein